MGRDDINGALVRPGRRPILNAGIALCAAVVTSLTVIICAYADPPMATGDESLCALACMVVAYAVPCVGAMVVVIMRDVCVPRRARYVMAAVSFGVLCFLAAFPVMGIIAIPTTEMAQQLDVHSGDIVRRGTWLIVVLGLLMGFAVPVSTKAKGDGAGESRRRLIQGFLVCLLWTSLSFQMAYYIMANNAGILAMGPAVTYVIRSTIMPLNAFVVSSLIVSWAWGYATIEYPSWLHKILLWVPVVSMAVFLALDAVDVLTLHVSLSIDYTDFRISDVSAVYTALLGILFGVALSAVDE
ncbi:hypothetical protein AAK967_07965 [Atopobiaceae bacterium 24-176]